MITIKDNKIISKQRVRCSSGTACDNSKTQKEKAQKHDNEWGVDLSIRIGVEKMLMGT